MVIRAVGFDIGGVLQQVDPPEVLSRSWQQRLGMSAATFDAAVQAVDPDNLAAVGRILEPELRSRYSAALGLVPAEAEEFMADLWDRYCGQLDTELAGFAAGLRPGYRTGILSNSADGARREEQARHGVEDLVDVVIYSHEAGVAKPDPRAFELLCRSLDVAPRELIFVDDWPANVAAATALGIRGVLHVTAAQSITAIANLLASAG